MADALAYAHQTGVIHRDIKPVNILFTDFEHKHPVLTDFGIARILGETAVTADGRFMGSPAYLSPEIALGHAADARTDIYGLGLTLYEMVTGRMPYSAADATGMVMQHMVAPLPSPRQFNPDIPPVVEFVMGKALAKTREHRYQSAAEFKAVMVRLLENMAGLKAPTAAKKGGTTQIVVDNPSSDPTLTPVLDNTTLPFESAQDSRTRTLPFDEPVLASMSSTAVEAEEKPRRRRPLIAVVVLLLLAGLGGYAVLNGGLTLAVDDPTATQPAVLIPVSSATPTTEPPTATLTATSTPTLTLTATLTPTLTPSLDLPPVRENPFSKPTAAPTDTPTSTPTVRVAPTQSSSNPTQNPGQVSNPTAVPPTNPPAAPPPAGGGGDGGGGNNNPVAPVVEPVQDIIDEVLPDLPCILNCG